MKVYAAINKVQAALAKTGIAKAHRNSQQGYYFRGIDDVYAALAPLLSAHGLCILPRVLTRTVTERTTPKGGVLFYTAVEVEFDFVCAEDGSKHTVKTFGEAMDSGDKSTNKAMSAAYKYAAFQAFAIPTEGDNDSEIANQEVAAQAPMLAQAVIDAMRDAAMNGEPALREAWQKHNKAPGFGAWWQANSDGLKQAAAQAAAPPVHQEATP